VAFLEVAGLCSGVEKIRALRAAAADLRLVACARDLPGGDVVELLRAGAADCYHSGMSAEDVAELVGRLRRESHIRAAAEPEDCAGHVLGFLSLKPGSGATTLAVQAAFALRRQTGKPVLLIDLNLDAGTLGLTGEIPADHLDVVSAIEALPDLEAGEAWIHRTISRNGIRILPAPFAPFGDSPGMLGAGIRSLIALARRHFEWVILDMAPAAEAGTMTLAATLDQVVVVATPELPCLHLARRRVDELVRAGCQRAALRLALNRTSSKDLIPKDSMESVLSRTTTSRCAPPAT
jgi:pilus assembly protein CpaE